MIRTAIAGIVSLLAVATASAQQFPTVPDHSVIGRIGIGGSSGPSQAIPFTILNQSILNALCQTNNAFPVYSTSAASWVCSTAPSANQVYAGPSSGGAAQPTFRALVGSDLPLPAASTLGAVFSKTATASNWLRSLGTDGNFTISQPAFTDISGSVAATQLPNPSSTTLGGVKSLAAVSHNFLTSISTAGQPTQAQPACADLSDSTACNAANGQLPATATNDSAAAGKLGEYAPGNVAIGSAVPLTTATPANLTSVSLTAGDWDVTCNAFFNLAATTSITNLVVSISQTSATLDGTTAGAESLYRTPAAVPGGAMNVIVGPFRVSLSGTTTVFCVVQSAFTVSTNAAFGQLRARRAR